MNEYWTLPTHKEKLLGWWESRRDAIISSFEKHIFSEHGDCILLVSFDCGAGHQQLTCDPATLEMSTWYWDESGAANKITLQ